MHVFIYYLFPCLFICSYVHLFLYSSVYLVICLSIHLFIYFAVNMLIRLFICLFAINQCSYSVCMKSRDDSLRLIEEYADVWRAKPHDFQCFYDTEFPDKVIASKTYSRLDVIHCMLWPSVVIIICGVIFLRMEALRRGLTFCGNRKSITVTKTRPEAIMSPEEKWPPTTAKTASNAKAASNNACNKRQQRDPDAACNLMQPPVALNNACNNGKPVNRNVDRCCDNRERTSRTRLSSSMSSLEKSTALRDGDQGPWPLPVQARSPPAAPGKCSSIDRLKEDARFISLKGEAQSKALVGEML